MLNSFLKVLRIISLATLDDLFLTEIFNFSFQNLKILIFQFSWLFFLASWWLLLNDIWEHIVRQFWVVFLKSIIQGKAYVSFNWSFYNSFNLLHYVAFGFSYRMNPFTKPLACCLCQWKLGVKKVGLSFPKNQYQLQLSFVFHSYNLEALRDGGSTLFHEPTIPQI